MGINIGAVLAWKFKNAKGIDTAAGVITAWPAALGPKPTEEQIVAWTAEYELVREDIEARAELDGNDVLSSAIAALLPKLNAAEAAAGVPLTTEPEIAEGFKAALTAKKRAREEG